MEGLPDNLTDDDITYFKYAPITSTDVEHNIVFRGTKLCSWIIGNPSILKTSLKV